MDTEGRRTCAVDDCERQLRSNNTTGYCPDHKSAKSRGEAGDTPPRTRAPKASAEPEAETLSALEAVDKLLKVTQALGIDGDSLVVEFVEAYLDRLRAAAKGEG
jgi:hypothetical protein